MARSAKDLICIAAERLFPHSYASGLQDMFSMKRAIAWLVWLFLFNQLPAQAADSLPLSVALREHCVQCHGADETVEGNLNLMREVGERFAARPEDLKRLIEVLRDRRMPPESEPALPDATRAQMLQQVVTLLEQAVHIAPYKPIPLRRMNRFQYNNAVVDLLELDRDIFQSQ